MSYQYYSGFLNVLIPTIMKATENQSKKEDLYLSPDIEVVEIEFEQNILAGSGSLDGLYFGEEDY